MLQTRMEIIPGEDGLLVAIGGKEWTSYVRGFSEQITSVARDLLAAECSWMPKDIMRFARDVSAGRTHSFDIGEWLSEPLPVEIPQDEREQTEKALKALRELRSLLAAVFAISLKHGEIAAGGDTGFLQ